MQVGLTHVLTFTTEDFRGLMKLSPYCTGSMNYLVTELTKL